ncbi:hypothetical protein [Pallidibacillus pasinlerensis]|uniref:Uncharacterized protein n=1 Tax=Pallidibacillus pasinlerensis TaxID=2703818 RepID=A0ABX0AAE1_9BACI|nr:hypothetical protein [Pallidibacillus pasinlerensis]NCU18385.1 hypothetical protein [Pallidibacillus pasinlerensis]
MTTIEGRIFSGSFDEEENTFTLQKVKHFHTETSMKEKQLQQLYQYLSQSKDDDGQVLTLYDQLLVHLSNEEINDLLNDIDEILTNFQ